MRNWSDQILYTAYSTNGIYFILLSFNIYFFNYFNSLYLISIVRIFLIYTFFNICLLYIIKINVIFFQPDSHFMMNTLIEPMFYNFTTVLAKCYSIIFHFRFALWGGWNFFSVFCLFFFYLFFLFWLAVFVPICLIFFYLNFYFYFYSSLLFHFSGLYMLVINYRTNINTRTQKLSRPEIITR